MHFHSGMGCCAVQSELRPEVSLFISSVAETKEQWERRRESGGEQIIIPGDSVHKISRKAYMFLGFGGGLYVSFGGDKRQLLSWKRARAQAWKVWRQRCVLANVAHLTFS